MKRRHWNVGRIYFGTRGWLFSRHHFGPQRWGSDAFGVALGPFWIGWFGPVSTGDRRRDGGWSKPLW